MTSRAFRLLSAFSGGLFVLAGILFFFQFFRYHAPGGAGIEGMPMGPNGHYFVAFTGCALVGWGGCLFAAAREPLLARTIGTATAVALVMSAVYRMLVWILGDYAALGALPRFEAGLFLIWALAFVWLRPDAAAQTAAPRNAAPRLSEEKA